LSILKEEVQQQDAFCELKLYNVAKCDCRRDLQPFLRPSIWLYGGCFVAVRSWQWC